MSNCWKCWWSAPRRIRRRENLALVQNEVFKLSWSGAKYWACIIQCLRVKKEVMYASQLYWLGRDEQNWFPLFMKFLCLFIVRNGFLPPSYSPWSDPRDKLSRSVHLFHASLNLSLKLPGLMSWVWPLLAAESISRFTGIINFNTQNLFQIHFYLEEQWGLLPWQFE